MQLWLIIHCIKCFIVIYSIVRHDFAHNTYYVRILLLAFAALTGVAIACQIFVNIITRFPSYMYNYNMVESNHCSEEY